MTSVASEWTVAVETHPYLLAHSLHGTPILPLAAAIDLLAWSQDLRPPFSLRDVDVGRVVLIRAPVRLRVKRVEDALSLVEVRPGGREINAFHARVGEGLSEAPVVGPSGRALPIDLEVADFYRRHTFHGPALQAIVAVAWRTLCALQGTVRTSTPAELAPVDPRACWHADPLLLDGALQMALYHSVLAGLGPVLPRSVDEVVLLRPPAPGPVDVRVEGRTPRRADVLLMQDQTILGWLRGLGGQSVGALA